MVNDEPLFILAGNAAYENRGCEAITRGTVEILRESFRNPRVICLSHFLDEQQYNNQCVQEKDNNITHLRSYRLNKYEIFKNFWKPFYLSYAFNGVCYPENLKYKIYSQMLPYLGDADAILSIGGDNYSLDYGIPKLFTDLDDIIIAKKKPLILWGASVGPFSRIPDYERYMSDHLKKVTGIFARETTTVNYLENIGVSKNVHCVADPAFLMDPVKPAGIDDDFSFNKNEGIGLNFSPLMANYVTCGDLEKWIQIATSITSEIEKKTEMPIYLIPHVTSNHSDDYAFMEKMISQLKTKNKNIILIPPKYNAAETKWIISQMSIFAGARTHATIASLSSCVPTLSFAYSIKARGINQDIFNHESYLISPSYLNEKNVTSKVQLMLEESWKIRRDLSEKIPFVQKLALSAGEKLKKSLIEL